MTSCSLLVCCDALSMTWELSAQESVLFSLGKDEMESLCRAQAGFTVAALKEGTTPLLRGDFVWLQIIQIISWISLECGSTQVWQNQSFRIAP